MKSQVLLQAFLILPSPATGLAIHGKMSPAENSSFFLSVRESKFKNLLSEVNPLFLAYILVPTKSEL